MPGRREAHFLGVTGMMKMPCAFVFDPTWLNPTRLSSGEIPGPFRTAQGNDCHV